ncbi:MAG: UDP-N-acetylmuramate dehydrogenase [Acidimicrobiia bacterium]
MIVDFDLLATELEAVVPGRVERNVAFSGIGTYRLGGPIAVLVRIGNDQDVDAVAEVVRRVRPRVLVLGRGSNLVVADGGFAGLGIMGTDELEAVAVGERTVVAGAACPLPVLARRSAAAGRTGLEFYVGIPGSVGGAIQMNAGGHGQETAAVCTRAWVVDFFGAPGIMERSVDSLAFSYRHSALRRSDFVVRAEFAVALDDPEACNARIDEIVRWRREHQPGGQNAGSVFRNPPGDHAGRLIEAAGCKGFRVGGASVSEKHANFFQAEPGATAADVAALVREVAARVEATSGVRLQPEIRFVGFDDGPTGGGA